MPTGLATGAAWIGSNAAAIGAVATAASTAVSIKSGKDARKKAQAEGASQVKPLGQQDKPQAAKDVDLGAIQRRNAQMAAAAGQQGGNQATLLSGAQGVATNTLNLGTSTLLGQ